MRAKSRALILLKSAVLVIAVTVEDNPPVGVRRIQSLLHCFFPGVVGNNRCWALPPELREPSLVLICARILRLLVVEVQLIFDHQDELGIFESLGDGRLENHDKEIMNAKSQKLK
jgi:hypothetical protein